MTCCTIRYRLREHPQISWGAPLVHLLLFYEEKIEIEISFTEFLNFYRIKYQKFIPPLFHSNEQITKKSNINCLKKIFP